MKPLRVLMVNKLYHPHIGGMERVVQDLAEGLKDRIDPQVLACEARGVGSRRAVNGIRVVKARSVGVYLGMPLSFSFPVLLRKLARDVDIVHVHLPFPLAVWGFPWRTPAKLVVTWHSGLVRYRVLDMITGPQTRAFLGAADRIAVGSPSLLDATAYLRPYRDKCRLIPFGIEPERYLGTPIRQRLARAIQERYGGGPLVLFVGRFAYYKGLEVLLEAMQRVDPRAVLVLVGDGPLRPRIERLVRLQGLGDRVVFPGSLPEDDLLAHYHAASLLVLPSLRESEAFGLVQLEAMVCGLPVVNTRLPTGVPWVSPHGETGLTVSAGSAAELGGAIQHLLGDERLRREMGERGRARVREHFTRDKMCDAYYTLYRQLA